MKYPEDDFELAEFKQAHDKNQIAPKRRNIFLSFAMTAAELALAFIVAYFLFRSGQYLIDLFIN